MSVTVFWETDEGDPTHPTCLYFPLQKKRASSALTELLRVTHLELSDNPPNLMSPSGSPTDFPVYPDSVLTGCVTLDKCLYTLQVLLLSHLQMNPVTQACEDQGHRDRVQKHQHHAWTMENTS